MQNQAVERIVDEVWARAVRKIAKGVAQATLRAGLGDEINLVIPQAVTSTLMRVNPGFSHVLYSSAYASSKRNAYLMTRQLGMPPDFFWKFDYWSPERAFETLKKVMGRVFAAVMTRQKQGTFDLTAVDVERCRFEMVFADCAECSGLEAAHPMCLFHAGLFAGIVGALLDRDLDAVETECRANGGKACVFKVGKPEDREIKPVLEERLGGAAPQVDVPKRMGESLDGRAVRDLGNLVDVWYYQLLLSSVFLAHLDVLSAACMDAGDELGQAMATLMPQRFQGDAASAVSAFYRDLLYTNARVVEQPGLGIAVEVEEAPETMGPLSDATLMPFLCGELQGLLSTLMQRPLRFQSWQREGERLVLRFAP
jgi:hypothetical protein